MELLPEVAGLRGNGLRSGQQGQGAGVGPEFHAVGAEFSGEHRQERGGFFLMHQQALKRVADAGALDFAVVGEAQGHAEIRPFIYIKVAHAHVVLEHGHGGGFAHGAHQRFPAPGDHDVHIFVKFAERGDGGAIRGFHDLRRILGQPGAAQRFVEEPGQREVGMDGLRAAAQDHGVSGLQAKDGGVDGDVGARLENHGDDPERDAHLADHKPVGALPLLLDDADFISHLGDMQTGIGHIRHDARREGEPVEARSVHVCGLGGVHVEGVGLEDVRLAFDEQCGERAQGLRFGRGSGGREHAGGLLGALPHLFHLKFDRNCHGVSFFVAREVEAFFVARMYKVPCGFPQPRAGTFLLTFLSIQPMFCCLWSCSGKPVSACIGPRPT